MILLLLICINAAAIEPVRCDWSSFDGHDSASIVHTAFVQTGAELHYFSETTKREKEMFTGGGVREARGPSDHIRKVPNRRGIVFRPNAIDFGKTDFGEASVHYVEVCNRGNVRDEGVNTADAPPPVHVNAILGDSPFIHSSFLVKDTLQKDECTRLSLAFLPRELGAHNGPLMIHTSEGAVYSIDTMGEATMNTLRVAPFVGSKVAINGTLRRELIIHNPYEWPMRITDIASSGGGLFVQLPNRLDPLFPANQQLWDLNPFESKHVANLLLHGTHDVNATAFAVVRMELQKDEGSPVKLDPFFYQMPFQCTSAPGVFPSTDLLDFGLIRYGDRSKQLILSAYSTLGKFKDWEVKRITMEPEESSAVYLEYAGYPPIFLYSNRVGVPGVDTAIVKVQIDTSYYPAVEGGFQRHSGRLVVMGAFGYNVSMPYTVGVYSGSLTVEGDDGCLHEGLPANSRHAVRIRSRLPFPVAIYNASLPVEAANHFTLRLFSRVVAIAPNEVAPVFLLKYNRKAPVDYTTHVTLHTNVSTFSVPIHVYDGKIEVFLHSPQQVSFDFGLVERNDSRTIRFEVRNPNPASISLLSVRLPYPEMTRLLIRGSMPLALEAAELPQWRQDERKEVRQGIDIVIPPRSIIYFDLLLRVLNEDVASGSGAEFVLRTDHETRVYPILYEVSKGRLVAIPSTLNFGKTHPGRVSYRTLQIFNSFDEDMIVTEVRPAAGDKSVYIEPVAIPEGSSHLLRSGRFTTLGKVLLMPPMDCSHDYCYLGLRVPTPVNLPVNFAESPMSDGQWFAHGLTLPTNLADIDSYLYKRARAKYNALVSRGRHLVNSSLALHTTRAKHVQIPIDGELTWPRLLTQGAIHFPLTAVGNFTILNLTLSNPTSEPIFIQLIPLVIYPDAEAFVDAFRSHLLSPLTSDVEMNETLMFSLRDTELFTLRSESPVPMLREEMEKQLGMNVPRFTLSAILQPHMKLRVRLGFLPSDLTLRSSLLIIRNNLTMVEPVVVYGRGGTIGLEVEKTKSRSKQPLYFEIRHDHLHDCNNPKRLMHRFMSTLTVRRPFTVTNTGEVPFTVVNISINNFPCENRGFRVLNCEPFRLKPNESYVLDIAHTPDFLSTTNEADLQLYMHMNGTAWVFPLAATIPPEMMNVCHAALPRPYFESKMYYLCMVALFFSLICVLACSYLEGDRAVICALRAHYASMSTIFDLNSASGGGFDGGAGGDDGADDGAPGASAPDDESPGGVAIGADYGSSRAFVLSAGDDAPVYTRLFFALANLVLWCIQPVWKFTLLWRRDKRSRSADSDGCARRGRHRRRRAPAATAQTHHHSTTTATASTMTSSSTMTTSDVSVADGVYEHANNSSQSRLQHVERLVDGPEGRGRKVSSQSMISQQSAVNGETSSRSSSKRSETSTNLRKRSGVKGGGGGVVEEGVAVVNERRRDEEEEDGGGQEEKENKEKNVSAYEEESRPDHDGDHPKNGYDRSERRRKKEDDEEEKKKREKEKRRRDEEERRLKKVEEEKYRKREEAKRKKERETERRAREKKADDMKEADRGSSGVRNGSSTSGVRRNGEGRSSGSERSNGVHRPRGQLHSDVQPVQQLHPPSLNPHHLQPTTDTYQYDHLQLLPSPIPSIRSIGSSSIASSKRSSPLLTYDDDPPPSLESAQSDGEMSEAPDWDDVDPNNVNADADLSAMVEATARGFDVSREASEDRLHEWEESGGRQSAIGSEKRRAREEEEKRRRRMEEEERERRREEEEYDRKKRDEEEERRRREEEEKNEMVFKEAISRMQPFDHLFNSREWLEAPLLDLNPVTNPTSMWPSTPPHIDQSLFGGLLSSTISTGGHSPRPDAGTSTPSMPSPGPPPGFEHTPTVAMLSRPLPPLNTGAFGTLFSGDHFATWGQTSSTSGGWDPFISRPSPSHDIDNDEKKKKD